MTTALAPIVDALLFITALAPTKLLKLLHYRIKPHPGPILREFNVEFYPVSPELASLNLTLVENDNSPYVW
jgi:hypothetical protein